VTVTTVVRWSPFRELEPIDRYTRRMFEGFTPGLFPSADIYETKDEFLVELEVPGYEEKELGIEVSDHTLTITGKRTETKKEVEKKEKTFRLQERLEKEFERSFVLPREVNTEKVSATFRKGILEVHAPKNRGAHCEEDPDREGVDLVRLASKRLRGI
jgi:HSP20 family protein